MISKDLAWPRGVEESKDKEAKRAYRQKCESFATYDSLLFKLKSIDAAVRPSTVKTAKLGDTVGLTASVTARYRQEN